MLKNLVQHSKNKATIHHQELIRWSQSYQKYKSPLAFIVGFTYDSLTLTRIDSLRVNIILLGYLILAGMIITLLGLSERKRMPWNWVVQKENLLTNILHFCVGGLLSSYVVFYFKSAALGKSFIFVVLLVGLLLANGFLAHRLQNLRLLTAVYFFVCFAFFTFFLPIITHRMSARLFLGSGMVSFLILTVMLGVIFFQDVKAGIKKVVARKPVNTATTIPEDGMARESVNTAATIPEAVTPELMTVENVSIGGTLLEMLKLVVLPALIFSVVVGGYFLNWIPPVPLALKEGGIYRNIKREGDRYLLTYQAPLWWEFWKKDDKQFHNLQGQPIYCFTSVFAPTALSQQLVHEWQQQSNDGHWITRDWLSYAINGGREGGYRGYTYKRKITPGHWRVEVRTLEGLLLGRIPFEVIESDMPPIALKTVAK